MITVLVFAALIAAWWLLHRASLRPGWGFVGVAPTRAQILMRSLERSIMMWQRYIGEALLPSLKNLTEQLVDLHAAFAKHGSVTLAQAAARIRDAARVQPQKEA